MSGEDLALDLPLAGTQLIEASAGTGKTFTIAGLYLRAIVERRLAVREILVVTFTRAATEELKQRLRKRLLLCAELAELRLTNQPDDATLAAEFDDSKNGPPNAEYRFAQVLVERALASEDAEKPVELARRLRLAAVSMDEAAIHTIDAFCQRALREHAFASGQALDSGELVGSDRDLIETISADFWRRRASDAARLADFEVLRDKLGGPKGLALILQGVEDPALRVHPPVSSEAPDAEATLRMAAREHDVASAALCAAWEASGEADFEGILDYAKAGHLNQTSYKPERVSGWLESCRSAFSYNARPDRSDLAFFGASVLARKIKKGRPSLPKLAFACAVDIWLQADDALEAARNIRWTALLAELRSYGQEQLERRKQRAERFSYTDIVRHLHTAICVSHGGEQLAASLHARYPIVLVDEFQDTDARQFAIFQSIQAAGNNAVLFLVGDPKQAIYRFRGGDIEAYLAAADSVQTISHLETNFRSTPAYLTAVEAVFSQADDSAFAFVDPRIHFRPVAPNDRVHNNDILIDDVPITPLTCWHLPETDQRLNKDDTRTRLAEGCAEEIVRLLEKARAGRATLLDSRTGQRNPLAPHNIAVLVATNREAALMQRTLAGRGVASATIRQESVFASEEADEVLRVLSALDGRDDSALRGALATRLFGRDAAHIAALVDDANPEAWQDELQRLDALHEHWLRHGVLALIERILEARAASILRHENGERRLTNYLQLAELLQAQALREYSTAGLIAWLRRRIDDSDDHNEAEQLRLESDAQRVQIATIHASKGLEYDLVFLPFTALSPGSSLHKPALLAWHSDAQRQVRVFACGDNQKDDAALEQALQATEREELAEQVRVLYVALTRARYACWLSWDAVGSRGGVAALAQLWHAGTPPSDSGVAIAALQRLASSAHGSVIVQAVPEATVARLDVLDAAPLPPARTFAGHVDADWWIASYSQLRDGEHRALGDTRGTDDETASLAANDDAENVSQADDVSADSTIVSWPRGNRFGTAMHEILELINFSAWCDHATDAAPDGERDMILMRIRRHALAFSEREKELLRVVEGMLAATMNVRLPDDARLCTIPATDRRAELPFHFAIGSASSDRLIALLREHGYQRQRAAFARAPIRIAGLMTGVIDLVYRHDGRWWIVDYKTNWLGAQSADYSPAALDVAVRDHDYDLQYLIYTLALHRWLRLRLGERYDYERDFGGAIYLFLRGLARDGSCGVHVDRPPRSLIEEMDELLAAEAHA